MSSLLALLFAFALAAEPPQASWPHAPEATEAEAADEPALDPAADPRALFLAWQRGQAERLARAFPQGHPEPGYRFLAELYGEVAPLVAERTGVVTPFVAGTTVRGRPIWAFRVRKPLSEPSQKVLVFAGIHALEWISCEVAIDFLRATILNPLGDVEVVVVPILNVDGRHRVEMDFQSPEPRPYRRANAHGVDLNRDFEVHRESKALWKAIVPGFYYTSPAPLSQPESQVIDRLGAEGFDVAISLHAFGSFIYYPWSGRFAPPPDRKAYALLGDVMVAGQPSWPYQAKQLSRWGFFFRALGTELDHLYGKYGTYSFLIELTRSGIQPFDPKTWKNHFRWYNPEDPSRARAQGLGALRALVHYADAVGLPPRPAPAAPP